MQQQKMSPRSQQRALREEMRALGMSYRQIAAEFARRWSLRPRAAWRNAHGWSLTEAAAQVNAFAGRTGLDPGGNTVVMSAAHLCEYENWPGEGREPAGRRPTPYLLSLLTAVYGCDIEDLLDVADYRNLPAAARLVLDKTAHETSARESTPPPVPSAAGPESAALTSRAQPPGDAQLTAAAPGGDEVASAASSAAAEQRWLLAEPDPHSADSLCGSAAEIARAANRSPVEIFSASRSIRALALDLTGHVRRPSALADLYATVAQMTALMASAAFDLDRWDESATLAQSAFSYAALVGHVSLQAWSLGLSGLMANWRSDPDTALGHCHYALSLAPPGTPRARIRHIAARSHALLGDEASVRLMLADAERDQQDAQTHPDLLCEEVAGEFGFGQARADACAAAAWLDLGCGSQARDAAARALLSLAALPPGRQPVSQVIGTRIDLATACLLSRERDEAQQILGQVLTIRPPLANVSLSGRLARFRAALGSPAWSADPAAQALGDAISEWLASGGPC
jgi:hypothetical protein